VDDLLINSRIGYKGGEPSPQHLTFFVSMDWRAVVGIAQCSFCNVIPWRPKQPAW